jgi:histidinol phosphatase-like PHP family hydrolase
MILAAAKRGVQEVCITDHYSAWKPALLEFNFEEYYTRLNELRNHESLGPKIFIGIEVDLTSIESFYPLQDFQWDLVLFEYVFGQSDWKEKFQQVLNFKRKNQNYNVGLAHTRFTRVSESKIDSVLEKIREFEIIIELNTGYGNYTDKWFSYFDDEFMYSIGSDAHHVRSLGTTTHALDFLKERNISLDRIIHL